MQIVYFIQDRTPGQIAHEFLVEIGLGYAFDRKPACRPLENGKGPDGKSGCVVGRSEKGNVASIGYYPEKQQWTPMATVDGVLMGIDNSAPITPREMVRSDWLNSSFDEASVSRNLLIIESHDVCSKGQFWAIPVARAWSLAGGETVYQNSLPRSLEYKLDDEGKPSFFYGKPIERFARLEELALVIEESYHQSELPDNYYDVAAEVLSLAYHIGPQEMVAIGIVDSDPNSVAKLLFNVLDEPGMAELVKKKQSDSDDSNSG